VEGRTLLGNYRLTVATFDLEKLTSAHQRAASDIGFTPVKVAGPVFVSEARAPKVVACKTARSQ
jgi:hypothetical protein